MLKAIKQFWHNCTEYASITAIGIAGIAAVTAIAVTGIMSAPNNLDAFHDEPKPSPTAQAEPMGKPPTGYTLGNNVQVTSQSCFGMPKPERRWSDEWAEALSEEVQLVLRTLEIFAYETSHVQHPTSRLCDIAIARWQPVAGADYYKLRLADHETVGINAVGTTAVLHSGTWHWTPCNANGCGHGTEAFTVK